MQEGHGHDHAEEASGAALDPHVWTSPKNAAIITAALSEALCEADPQNAAAYTRATKAYIEELEGLDVAFEQVVQGAARRTLVFGDRFPFRYLADAYGLTYYAAFPGCSATVAFLIDKVQAEQIPVVFHIELSNQRMAEAICEQTGAQMRQLHSCHNLTRAEQEQGASYLSIMGQNLAALKEALG